jgi:hypothetical protein
MPPFKSIPREKWIRFLKKEGLSHVRSTASHEIWDRPDKPLNRPIVFRPKDRDIPRLHLDTCLKTLGLTHKEFLEKIAEV